MYKYFKKRRKSSKMSKKQTKKSAKKAEKKISVPAPISSKEPLKEEEKMETKNTETVEEQVLELDAIEEEGDFILRHRKKKGRRPTFKKIQRQKPVRNVGTVEREKNSFFPADVDFQYTSTRENWVSFFGQEEDFDFGDSVRILPDESEINAQRMI